MASLKPTITQRRAALTEAVKKARAEYQAIVRKVDYQVRKEHKDLPWYEQFELRESNPEVIKANERLLALCDAANIMGAEID